MGDKPTARDALLVTNFPIISGNTNPQFSIYGDVCEDIGQGHFSSGISASNLQFSISDTSRLKVKVISLLEAISGTKFSHFQKLSIVNFSNFWFDMVLFLETLISDAVVIH